MRTRPLDQRMILAMALWLTGGMTVWAASPRALQKQAIEHAAAGDLEQAETIFRDTLESVEGLDLDPAVSLYNLATAELELGKHQQAADRFDEALHTENQDVLQRAYYSRGNALTGLARTQEAAEQLQPAIQSVEQAIDMYEQSMLLDPSDSDPKINYELANRDLLRLQELLQQQQQQQQQEQDEQEEEQEPEEDQEEQNQEGQSDQSEEDSSEQEQPPPESGEQEPQQDGEQNQQPSQPRDSQEMTEEEAEMLLNAMREEEDAVRRQYRLQHGQPREVEKDW